MAEKRAKSAENAPGKFFVDASCIGTDFCIATAPEHFRMSESGQAYVYRQPETPEQEKLCREALAGCPVCAIGDNGDD